MRLTRELLIRYQRQNPRKYAVKFGNKTPDEVLVGQLPQPEMPEGPVKIEVTEAQQVETGFAQAIDPEIAQLAAERIESKKRGGRKNGE